MGPLATIPRGGRSWGNKPARRSDRYHKSQTIQMLGAFAPHTGEGMGTSMRYDVAEIVDPQVDVVAKVSKKVLSQLIQ